ncbi:MAG: hypothetical protein ACYTG1_11355 [Planctomycetota bacterium]|jgi:hypothetical protein
MNEETKKRTDEQDLKKVAGGAPPQVNIRREAPGEPADPSGTVTPEPTKE